MNNWDHIATPDLMKNAARFWKLSYKHCEQCDGPTFHHLITVPGILGYSRCPTCQLNSFDIGASRNADRTADRILDALIRRHPSIGEPQQQ